MRKTIAIAATCILGFVLGLTLPGCTGDKGDQGDAGGNGPQRPQGEDGLEGMDGEDGMNVDGRLHLRWERLPVSDVVAPPAVE